MRLAGHGRGLRSRAVRRRLGMQSRAIYIRSSGEPRKPRPRTKYVMPPNAVRIGIANDRYSISCDSQSRAVRRRPTAADCQSIPTAVGEQQTVNRYQSMLRFQSYFRFYENMWNDAQKFPPTGNPSGETISYHLRLLSGRNRSVRNTCREDPRSPTCAAKP